jgi:16S rRNA (guanine1207-N2)-methyltransferase
MDKDVYFHKTVTFNAGIQQLELRTSQELFSSHDIDTGTRFLLRSIIEGEAKPKTIFDLGCGYGPLGLMLKKIYTESIVHMLDRDALAVAYSRQNAELNELKRVEIYGSLGYDDVKSSDFDLIVANIPGKAGEAVIAYLLGEARHYLKPGGIAAIVIVAALEPLAIKTLTNTPGCEIMLQRKRSGHAIFHYRFSGGALPKPGRSALERGVYQRDNISIRLDDLEYSMQTAYGLPEFDSLSFGSEMMLETLKKTKEQAIRHAAVFNPGQGHIAVAIDKLINPETIELLDRDLLALRYSRRNLIQNGCPPERIALLHQVGVERGAKEKLDLIAGLLRNEGRDANLWILRQATEELKTSGLMIIAGGSTAITRLTDSIEQEKRLRIKSRERRRGYSLLILEKV